MKKFYLILVIAFSFASMANTIGTVFKSDTIIPQSLQEKILYSINEKCSKVISSYGLSEIATTAKKVRIDQGIVDTFYSTTFASRYYFDGMHPATTYITVESAEYAFQNSDNLEVVNIICD